MRFHLVGLVLASFGAAAANAAPTVQATCTQPSGEKQLSRLSEDYIEVRSGAATRAVPLRDIESIDVTGPVNRINRVAWATVKTRGGESQSLGLALENGGSLVLDGYSAQGNTDSIDVLSCKRISFRTGS